MKIEYQVKIKSKNGGVDFVYFETIDDNSQEILENMIINTVGGGNVKMSEIVEIEVKEYSPVVHRVINGGHQFKIKIS